MTIIKRLVKVKFKFETFFEGIIISVLNREQSDPLQ